MIKYKVKDAAADFGVPNKKITEILKAHCGVDKKTMTTLQESELDVLFDVITKENSVENFDAYFAVRNAKLEQEPAPVVPEAKEAPKEEEKPAAKADGKQPAAAAVGSSAPAQGHRHPRHQCRRGALQFQI